jgi:hypothetical protein
MGVVDGATVTVDLTQSSSNVPVAVFIIFAAISLAGYYLFSRKNRKK